MEAIHDLTQWYAVNREDAVRANNMLRQAIDAFTDAECLARVNGGTEHSSHLLDINHEPCRASLRKECGL